MFVIRKRDWYRAWYQSNYVRMVKIRVLWTNRHYLVLSLINNELLLCVWIDSGLLKQFYIYLRPFLQMDCLKMRYPQKTFLGESNGV